jgi:hypothetical protein
MEHNGSSYLTVKSFGPTIRFADPMNTVARKNPVPNVVVWIYEAINT